jgi:GNAT superfamily N-acetyltransferase
MSRADISLGMRLKAEAGWNQTPDDWSGFLGRQPDGCFVGELDGQPVGTLVSCIFEEVAWLAMMLVDPQARGRGVAKALMTEAIGFLERQGVSTVRLDATPLGQPLYQQFGFVADYPLERFAGFLPRSEQGADVRSLDARAVASVLELDRAATGSNRRRWLERLAAEQPERIRVAGRDGQVEGYVIDRPGTDAVQLGPWIAGPDAGPLLFLDAGARLEGKSLYVDIPSSHAAATALARACGLTSQRTFVRMHRGEPLVEQAGLIWGSSGPELG